MALLTRHWEVEDQTVTLVSAVGPRPEVKTMEFTTPVTDEGLLYGLKQYNYGLKIQDAFPRLTADEREFLMTGLTPDEWNALWEDDDETED